MPENSHKSINTFIFYISLPALTLLFIPKMELSFNGLIPLLVSPIIFLSAFPIFWLIGKKFNYPKETIGCFILVCGLGNTSFLGFPFTEAYYGTAGLPVAILVDQGSFLMLSTLGLGTALAFSNNKLDVKQLLWQIVRFPPFIAFLIALMLFGTEYPTTIEKTLEILASPLIPLALISVGMQLKIQFKEVLNRHLLLGLSYKLLIAPIIIWIALKLLNVPMNELNSQVSIFEAAMPPMITASILASQYELNAPLAQMLTGIGICLSFITSFLWWIFIG